MKKNKNNITFSTKHQQTSEFFTAMLRPKFVSLDRNYGLNSLAALFSIELRPKLENLARDHAKYLYMT